MAIDLLQTIAKSQIKQLELWAKDDIVPADLQDLCGKTADTIKHLLELAPNTSKTHEDSSQGIK